MIVLLGFILLYFKFMEVFVIPDYPESLPSPSSYATMELGAGGETGRHATLRSLCPQGREGSSPFSRTTSTLAGGVGCESMPAHLGTRLH